MRNATGPAVVGEDLFGRAYELNRLWENLEQGEHILMLAPRRVGKTSLMHELRRAPRENWDVFYVDVEGGEGPADCIAAILAVLATDHRYRSYFDAVPFSNAVKNVLAGLSSVSVNVDVLRVELKRAMGREWGHAADQLQARLTNVPEDGSKLLIILDELPLLISRILRDPDRKRDAELLLSRLRYWRQAPEMRGKVCTLIGGSIGLEGVLRRAGFSGLVNDLAQFHLESWSRPVAAEFLGELGRSYDFRLDESTIAHILELLEDPVPYHVQLFFSALRDSCQGSPSAISVEEIDRCFAERLAGASGTAHLDHYAGRLEIALSAHEHGVARNILGLACHHRGGVDLSDFNDLEQQNRALFRSVLRDLEADGYVRHEGGRLKFRSNLVREWWRKYHGRRVTP